MKKANAYSLALWERVRVRVLDRLLQAFSHPGVLETGKAEFRIRKSKEDGGGTSFPSLQSAGRFDEWHLVFCNSF
jgi:hypothetical protein